MVSAIGAGGLTAAYGAQHGRAGENRVAVEARAIRLGHRALHDDGVPDRRSRRADRPEPVPRRRRVLQHVDRAVHRGDHAACHDGRPGVGRDRCLSLDGVNRNRGAEAVARLRRDRRGRHVIGGLDRVVDRRAACLRGNGAVGSVGAPRLQRHRDGVGQSTRRGSPVCNHRGDRGRTVGDVGQQVHGLPDERGSGIGDDVGDRGTGRRRGAVGAGGALRRIIDGGTGPLRGDVRGARRGHARVADVVHVLESCPVDDHVVDEGRTVVELRSVADVAIPGAIARGPRLEREIDGEGNREGLIPHDQGVPGLDRPRESPGENVDGVPYRNQGPAGQVHRRGPGVGDLDEPVGEVVETGIRQLGNDDRRLGRSERGGDGEEENQEPEDGCKSHWVQHLFDCELGSRAVCWRPAPKTSTMGAATILPRNGANPNDRLRWRK